MTLRHNHSSHMDDPVPSMSFTYAIGIAQGAAELTILLPRISCRPILGTVSSRVTMFLESVRFVEGGGAPVGMSGVTSTARLFGEGVDGGSISGGKIMPRLCALLSWTECDPSLGVQNSCFGAI
eukprot:6204594-Pleurochrysis_carterae.AAC.3